MSPETDRISNRHFAQLYQMLIDTIPSSVLLIDTQGRIISANHNFLTKSRVSECAVVGKPMEMVFPKPLYDQMNLGSRVAAVFRTGQALRGERVVFRTPGMAAKTYYYSLIPFTWDNVVENVMLLIEDITEQVRLGEEVVRSARHLASVVESASDIVLSLSIQGKILTWNTAAVRITGYEVSMAVEHHFMDFCELNSRSKSKALLASVIQSGRTQPVELDILHRDGRLLAISWVFSAMRNTEGTVIGLVASGRNLTEQRILEKQLIQAERLAALGVMAGGIAHEIRNPLAVASSAAQLILQQSITKELQMECATRIHRNVQRASDIIENLLRFARPMNQGPMAPLDLGRVVREGMALVQNQMKLEQIDMTLTAPIEPISVNGNAVLLQQLIMNILLNALHAMAPGPRNTILLTLQANRHQAELTVADSGKGIPEADLSKVFDPFFTTMPAGRGTGLGLSISYAIVHQHGGTIGITSSDSGGTCVTIKLPLISGKGSL